MWFLWFLAGVVVGFIGCLVLLWVIFIEGHPPTPVNVKELRRQ